MKKAMPVGRRGFTLLELLVVIGIIAILISLAAVAYSTAQKSTRDARRKGDMKSIQSAMEQFYNNNPTIYTYPADGSCAQINSTTYIESGSLPKDPINTAPYTYSVTCTPTSYCACATLERGGGNEINGNCSNWGSGSYFCVSNLQ